MSEAELAALPRPRLFIEKLFIFDFRGIESLQIELEPRLTVIVGRNNAGKSRILRALALALRGVSPTLDDLTVGHSGPAEIHVVVAPHPDDEGLFTDALGRVLEPTVEVGENSERFAWCTRIERSRDSGVIARRTLLDFREDRGFFSRADPPELSRQQLQLFSAHLTHTSRDLSSELLERGSPVRKIMEDLEVSDGERGALDAALKRLGEEIVDKSVSLRAIKIAISRGEVRLGGLGTPELRPIPPRLEELSRIVSIDFDMGTGPLPVRLHGSGPRSIASLLTSSVLYERRLGRGGTDLGVHPVTLVEEPEAHLHPSAQSELPGLLADIPGQVIVSTHSPRLVTAADAASLRVLRVGKNGPRSLDVRPVEARANLPRIKRIDLHATEVEKMRRIVSQPLGDLVFASVVVLGDGTTEAACLPIVLRHALGDLARDVVVLDTGSMKNLEVIRMVVKVSRCLETEWCLFVDDDDDGRAAAQTLLGEMCADEDERRRRHVVCTGGALERLLMDHSPEVARSAAAILRPGASLTDEKAVARILKNAKGASGRHLARALCETHPSVASWPAPLRALVERVRAMLQ